MKFIKTLQSLYCLATASKRGLPDFLVIGAQKGGTTSLYRYLAEHPDIDPSLFRKEINYFEKRYKRGEFWYRSNFPEQDDKKLFYEASTNYLYHPLVPERIHKVLPNIKAIALLRNPIERAYSHYQHQVRTGEEKLSFEDAIDQEEKRLAGEEERIISNPGYFSYNHRNFSYLNRGLYLKQIQAWHKFFPKEQVLILCSENFRAETQYYLDQVFNFLNVSTYQITVSKKYHVGNYTDKISPEMRNKLKDYFHPHNQALYEYLGQDFGWE